MGGVSLRKLFGTIGLVCSMVMLYYLGTVLARLDTIDIKRIWDATVSCIAGIVGN